MGEIIFVTGTDTGVGKTVFSALLLAHLRAKKNQTRPLKLFSSGDRSDAELFHTLAPEFPLDEINPFYFADPVTPLIAARNAKAQIKVEDARNAVSKAAEVCDILIVEGAGGLLSPLGEEFDLATLINEFDSKVVIVAPNRLGVLNHVLLTTHALSKRSAATRVVLMEQENQDPSASTNSPLLCERLGPGKVFELPFLGPAIAAPIIQTEARRLDSTLARISQPLRFPSSKPSR